MKKIAVVPTLLTLGNGICGFIAIALASKISPAETPAACDWYFAVSGWVIMAAMVFDMFDGYVARLSKTASKFGGELDSLCDAISFGVAPAFLLLKIGPGWGTPLLHQLLAGIAALYMACALLRLARFNVDNTPDASSHKRFRGLPSPGAAGCLASLAIVRGGFPERLAQIWTDVDPEARQSIVRLVEVFSPIGALIVALLMVSNVPYPHVTKQILRGRRHLGHLIQVLIGVLIIVLMRELSLFLIFWIYALAMPVRFVLVKHLRREQMPTPDALPR
ncbi:MAG TPA: CDP-diacylglycerol--serine O-phosphatidyltransferase [Gemmataceae bacterium]|nr:CDP-diacylglycerol--serine O-phosphatidyltransferase [Gemmataceae bacterium]